MKEAVGWHALIPRPITGPEEALAFVNACSFCTWGPMPRLSFPNLAEATGETATSVLDRTWSWKDDLHFEQNLYYAKIIAGQPSFLAPDYLPNFISALAGRDLEHWDTFSWKNRSPSDFFHHHSVTWHALRRANELCREPGCQPHEPGYLSNHK